MLKKTQLYFQFYYFTHLSVPLHFIFFICSVFLSIPASFSASHCGFPPAAFSPDWKLFLVSHTHEHADKQVPPHSAVALLGCKKEVFHNKSGNSGNNRNNWEKNSASEYNWRLICDVITPAAFPNNVLMLLPMRTQLSSLCVT